MSKFESFARATIIARNKIRSRSGLPLLNFESDLDEEIASLRQEDYHNFYNDHRKQAEAVILYRYFPTENVSDSFMKSVKFGAEVSQIVKQWWEEKNGEKL